MTVQFARSMPSITPALSGIGFIPPHFIEDALKSAPAYDTKVANAIRRTIRCIHSLQYLHRTVDREDLEIYIGRSSASQLASRWREHTKEHRGHNYGVVLFRCDAERVVALEALAIRLIARLRERGALCVGQANVIRGGVGGVPRSGEEAVVYMTWRIGKPTTWEKPSAQDIREIAEDVALETGRTFTAKQLETGMSTLKRLSEYDPLRWWEP